MAKRKATQQSLFTQTSLPYHTTTPFQKKKTKFPNTTIRLIKHIAWDGGWFLPFNFFRFFCIATSFEQMVVCAQTVHGVSRVCTEACEGAACSIFRGSM